MSIGLARAKVRKSSTVRPSIYGTAATFTPERLMYYKVQEGVVLTSFFALVICLRKNMLTVSIFGKYASHSWVKKV